MSDKTNIFFPQNLSPQGFLTDMILAQMRSPSAPFNGDEGLKAKIYGEDFSKVTGNKLFFLHPDDRSKFLKETLPKTAKKNEGYFQNFKRDYTMRRYINFLNNMTPAQQAVLVPYIRLYTKTFQGKKFLRSREIVFNKEYRIPNVDPAAGLFNNGGKGNAGIEDMQVSRDFQYYGVTNRYSVEMSFFFDSFETFANGMQYDNAIGRTIDAIADGNAQALLGQDQGSGYISLIKKGSKKDETGNPIREYLFLEYGYKFPDNIDPNIVSPEDRVIFETQEKKELRLTCYKHDFRFSETGEVALQVSYVAAPEAAMGTRDEEKTNDVFLISNKGIIDEIMDEQPNTNLKIIEDLKKELLLIKQENDKRKKLLQNYCRDDEDNKNISKIDEAIKEANKLINSKKKALLAYVEHFFMRYFMKKNSLWNLNFKVDPIEYENNVLSPDNVVITQDLSKKPGMSVSLNKVSSDKKDTKKYQVNCDYEKKIKKLKDKNHFVPTIDDSYVPKSKVLKSNQIIERFGKAEKLLDGNVHESYAYYQALQTFTLSRMSAQAALIRAGITKQSPNSAIDKAILNQATDDYQENYGNITFFPLKALVAAAIDFTLDEKEDEKDFPIICLGNILTDSMGKEYFTNLGDLLVDIDFFKEWLYKSFIDIEKVDPTLDDFMNAIFESLVPSVLGAGLGHYTKGNHGFIGRQVYELSEDFLKEKDLFQDLISNDKNKREKAQNKLADLIKRPTKKSEVKRPLVIYYQESLNNPQDIKQAKSAFLKDYGKRNFNKKQDYTNGIYHVLMGQNSGIVKRLNFSYINDPALNTLFSMKNPNHLAAYLRYSYEASVEFVGNDLFFGKTAYFAIPKNQFNVSQAGLTLRKPSKDVFGLSGYYQISKTTDRISMGEYTTSVTAKNMFSPALEEAKLKKCPKKSSIESPSGGTGTTKNAKEKEYKNFVEHEIVEYINESFQSVPDLRERFNIKYLTKEEREKIKKETSSLLPSVPEVGTIDEAEFSKTFGSDFGALNTGLTLSGGEEE